MDATVTVTNIGAAEIPAHMDITYHYTHAEAYAIATYYTDKPIPAGGSATFTHRLNVLTDLGKTYVYAVANETSTIDEPIGSNNQSEQVELVIHAPFTSSVQSDHTVYAQGDTVRVTGHIEGAQIENRTVELYLIYDGYRDSHLLLTDENGYFSFQFVPTVEQCGHFDMGVCYPGVNSWDVQAQFNIYGLRREDRSYVSMDLQTGIPYEGNFAVQNPGVLDITGIRVKVLSQPEDCEIEFQPIDSVPAGEVRGIPFRLVSHAPSPDERWQPIKFEITSREGAHLTTTIYYYCRTPYPKLVASIPYIETTMVKDHTRNYSLSVVNQGGAETGALSLDLPAWITAATPMVMPSLRSGDSAQIVLQLRPTDEMPLNLPVTGNIYLSPANGNGLSVGYSITPVSEVEGTLRLDVCDEYTYYAEGAPHVADAKIQLYHPATGELMAEGVSDSLGICELRVPEGRYRIVVVAERHEQYQREVVVDPGTVTDFTVNLQISTIQISWLVEEAEVEDLYEIVTTVRYETTVPAPVVTMATPKRLNVDSLQVGQTLIYPMTLTNHGLIAANDMSIDPGVIANCRVEVIGYDGQPFVLPAHQAVTFPVRVTRLRTGDGGGSGSGDESGNGSGSGSGSGDGSGSGSGSGSGDSGNDQSGDGGNSGSGSGSGTGGGDAGGDSGNGSGDGSGSGNSGDGNGGHGTGGGGSSCAVTPVAIYFWLCGDEMHGSSTGSCIMLGAGCGGSDIGDLGGGGAPTGSGSGDGGSSANVVGTVLASECNTCANEMMKRLLECAIGFIPGVGCAYGLGNCIGGVLGITATGSNVYTCGTAIIGCMLEGTAGELFNALTCLISFVQPCGASSAPAFLGGVVDDPDDELAEVRRIVQHLQIDDNDPSYLQEFRQVAAIEARYLQAWIDLLAEYSSMNYVRYSNVGEILRMIQSVSDLSTDESFDPSQMHIPAINHTLYPHTHTYNYHSDGSCEVSCDFDFWVELYATQMRERALNTWRVEHDLPVENDNYVHIDSLRAKLQIILECEEQCHAMGYPDLQEMWNVALERVQRKLQEGSDGVCASVTLQIKQDMVLTRQAFRGTLSIYNGFDNAAMENVVVNLTVKNTETGEIADSHLFQVNVESLSQMDGEQVLGGTWSVDASSTGTATFLFIPTRYAAEDHPVVYAFGGTITYTDPLSKVTVTRDLFPVRLTVKPSPELDLTYFMQRDVYGDDPMTEDVVEPVKEGEFAVLMRNVGKGDAANVRMVTHQPEIIDNEKGLLVNFEITSAQLNGEERTLALGGDVTTDFGSIPAGGSSYAQWWIECSLMGHYSDYKIEATHVSSYGNKDLSLLNSVSIHELIRSIRTPGDEAIGWLCNDVLDGDDTPDRLYFADGDTCDVARLIETTIVRSDNEEETQYLLTLQPTKAGWNYGYLDDPTEGYQQLKSIVRLVDGMEIPLQNFWQTDRTMRDSRSPIYENHLHAVDYFESNGKQQYLLTFQPAPSCYLDVEWLTSLDEDVYYEPVTDVGLTFNKKILESTFTTDDISLECQGKQLDVSGVEILASDCEYPIYFLDLSGLTKKNGYYVLTVQTSEITDIEGFNGRIGRQLCWTQYLTGSEIESIDEDADSKPVIYDLMGNSVEDIATPGLYIIQERHKSRKVLVR